MASLLAANLSELPVDRGLREAVQLTRWGVFKIGPHSTQTLA